MFVLCFWKIKMDKNIEIDIEVYKIIGTAKG
jgi:hypothetical protein